MILPGKLYLMEIKYYQKIIFKYADHFLRVSLEQKEKDIS